MDKAAKNHNGSYGHSPYASILKYTGLFGGVQGFNVLVSVVRNKCAAVIIGAAGIGLTDILNRTSDFICSLTNLGISFSGVRQLSGYHASGARQATAETINTIRAWCLTTGIAGTLACALLAPFIAAQMFNDAKLTPAFLTISPIVAMLAVYGGETAILKGTRRLKRLAAVSAVSSLVTLAVTVAVYLTLGMKGVPIALLLGTAALTSASLVATRDVCPWRAGVFTRKSLAGGKALLMLGLAYVASGIAGSGAEIIVRAFINATGSQTDVGLYASGFVLCVTYTRIIFIAMDADYFPKLAAASGNKQERDATVCRQIDVCVLLMGPMLIAFLTFLPLIVRLLYTQEFMPAAGMCVAAGGYLFIKAIVSPMEYIPLAGNDSKTYLLVELGYDVVFVCLLMAGYNAFGLWGAGLALTVSYLADLACILLLYRRIYGFSLEAATIRIICVQGCLLVPAILMFNGGHGPVQCAAGGVLLLASAAYSAKRLGISLQCVRTLLKNKIRK